MSCTTISTSQKMLRTGGGVISPLHCKSTSQTPTNYWANMSTADILPPIRFKSWKVPLVLTVPAVLRVIKFDSRWELAFLRESDHPLPKSWKPVWRRVCSGEIAWVVSRGYSTPTSVSLWSRVWPSKVRMTSSGAKEWLYLLGKGQFVALITRNVQRAN